MSVVQPPCHPPGNHESATGSMGQTPIGAPSLDIAEPLAMGLTQRAELLTLAEAKKAANRPSFCALDRENLQGI